MIRLQRYDLGLDLPAKDNEYDSGDTLAAGICGVISFGIISGVASLLVYGPLDFTRTGYSYLTGNLPSLKSELFESTRADMRAENPSSSVLDLEKSLAQELRYEFKGTLIDQKKVSMERVWDASEKHADSFYERWVWASLH